MNSKLLNPVLRVGRRTLGPSLPGVQRGHAPGSLDTDSQAEITKGFLYKISVIAPVVLTSFLAGAPRAQAQESVKPTAPLVSDARLTVEQKVDRYLASLPDPFNGTILLAIGDRILMNKGYGLANRSYGIPNTGDTMYQIASGTKTFTAVLTLQLAEKGLIDLHAPIATHLPEYPSDKARNISIHHLLRHESGIKHHYQAIPEYWDREDLVFHTPREYLELFWNAELAHAPGEGVTYTTPGYCLIGIILERVTRRSYAELLTEYILAPLRMKRTALENNLTIHKNLATGYKKGLGGYVRDRVQEPSNILASGDIITTTGDLHKLLKWLGSKGDPLLSDEYMRLLLQPQGGGSRAYVGFLRFDNIGGETITVVGLGTGSNYGFRSRMTRLMELNACYIVLSNVHKDRAMSRELYTFLERVLLQELGLPGRKTSAGEQATVSPRLVGDQAALAVFEGYYRGNDGRWIVVNRDSKGLYQQAYYEVDGVDYVRGGRLYPVSETRFALEGREGVVYSYFKRDGRHISGIFIGKGLSLECTASRVEPADLAFEEYSGIYYSVELQKTYRFVKNGDHLVAKEFLGQRNHVLTPLNKDLFVCDAGFLVFERYSDGKVRAFRLRRPHGNYIWGPLFIRK